MIIIPLTLYSAVQIYEFPIFPFMSSSFTGIVRIHIITSSQIGSIALLVRALQSWVRIPFNSELRLYFDNYLSCVYNCDDDSSIENIK